MHFLYLVLIFTISILSPYFLILQLYFRGTVYSYIYLSYFIFFYFIFYLKYLYFSLWIYIFTLDYFFFCPYFYINYFLLLFNVSVLVHLDEPYMLIFGSLGDHAIMIPPTSYCKARSSEAVS